MHSVDDTGWDAVAVEAVPPRNGPVDDSCRVSGTRCTSKATHGCRCCLRWRASMVSTGHTSRCSRRSDESTPACSDAACRSTARASAERCSPTSRYRSESFGVALLARCAGLLGHIAEEQHDPIAMDIYTTVDRNTDYHPS